MSHITTIKAEIKDDECRRRAAVKLGLEIREKTRFSNFGRQTPCTYAIGSSKHQDEVGVVVNADGTIELQMDNWDSIIMEVGQNAKKLVQRYSAEVSIKAAKKQGWRVREEIQKDGSIKLYATAGAGAKAATGKKRW